MEVLRRSSVFAAEFMDAFDRSPTDKELVAQAKALGREFVHARLLRAGLAWSAPERAAPAPGGRLAEVCAVLLRLGECGGPGGRGPQAALGAAPHWSAPGDAGRHPPLLGQPPAWTEGAGLGEPGMATCTRQARPRSVLPLLPSLRLAAHPPQTSPDLPAQPRSQTFWRQQIESSRTVMLRWLSFWVDPCTQLGSEIFCLTTCPDDCFRKQVFCS